MRIASFVAVALVAGVLGGHAAHAGLLDDTVNGSYYFPDTATLADDEGTAVVSPSASFFFVTGVPNTTAAVTDGQITITFDASGTYNPATFSGVVMTDQTNSDIIGASIDSATNVSGFDLSDLSFTSNSVSINLQSLFIPSATDEIVIDVATSSSTPVPEPMGLSLLATGLIGLGIARRRTAG